jgi:hypothetical protein
VRVVVSGVDLLQAIEVVDPRALVHVWGEEAKATGG